MADGASAMTLGKQIFKNTTPVDNEEVALDESRLMCWPHVFRAINKKIKPVPKEAAKNILDDIATIQLSQSRKEFANTITGL